LNSNSDPRIEALYRSDRRGVILFVLALWITILFVLYVMWNEVTDPNIHMVLAVSAGALLLFNTASMIALLSHYANDKDAIYGLDLRYQDAAAAASRQPAV